MSTVTGVEFRRLSDVLGADVVGLDLRELPDAHMVARLREALNEYHLLAFRDQSLEGEQQVAFTQLFGELEGHVLRLHDGSRSPLLHVVSNLDVEGNPTERPGTFGNYFWHTDKSYHEVPSYATLLYALEVPPTGGNTQFANMHLAYESLPAETRERIEDLKLVHSWEASRINSGSPPATEEQKRERPPVSHPLVRTHPDTGRRLLYMGNHVSHIVGEAPATSRELVAELMAHATGPEFVYSHQWRPGDLVMWDNRSLLHRARDDFPSSQYRRVLHRTVLTGTVPV